MSKVRLPLRRRKAGATSPREAGGFAAGMSFAVFSFAVTAVLSLGTSILIARLYGIDVVGQYALALAPTSALIVLSTVREQPALVRKLAILPPRAPLAGGLFFAVFSFSGVLTVIVAAVVSVGTYFVYHGPVGHPELVGPAVVMLAGNAIISNTTWNFDTVFAAYKDGRSLFIVRLEEMLFFIAFLIGFSLIWDSVWAPAMASTLMPAIPLLHRIQRSRRWVNLWPGRVAVRAGFSELPPIIRFGLKMTPASLISGFGPQLGIWTLGISSTVRSVGAYSRAWNISKRFNDLQWRIAEMLLPALVERRDRAGDPEFHRTLTDSVRYVIIGLALPAAVVGGAARPVMEVFGQGFTVAAPALAITMLNPLLVSVSTMLGSSIVAANRPGLTNFSSMVSFPINLTAVVVLTPILGVTGPAFGPVLGPLCGGTMNYFMARKAHGVRFRQYWSPRFLPTAFAAYAAGFLSAFAVGNLASGFWMLPPALLAGTIAYGAVFAGLGGLTAADRQRIGALVARIRRGRRPQVADQPVAPTEIAA